VVAWGYNFTGQNNVPTGLTNVVQVAAGSSYTVALKSDGTVVAWGYNGDGQCNVPAGLTNVVQVAAGVYNSVALKSDGTVVPWGFNGTLGGSGGKDNIPAPAGLSGVVQVASGPYHKVALKSDGTVVAWGYNFTGQCNVPAGLSNVVQVAAGVYNSIALKSDGTVVQWESYMSTIPAGLRGVVQVASGFNHNVVLKSDGTVVAWGYNGSGQCNVPAGLSNVVQVASGESHSVAVKSDGTVVAWGDNSYGQCNVPAGLYSVVQVAAGEVNTMALGLVNLTAPTIGEFNIPEKYFGNLPFDLYAPSSTSAGPWSYISGNTDVATVSGNTVTIVGAGNTVITATQAASGYFKGSSTSMTLVVNKESQEITGFSAFSSPTYGSVSTIPLSANNSSGQPIVWTSSNTNVAVVNGTSVTVLGAGTTTITASQAGDANWQSATPVSQTLVINKASQSILFSSITNQIASSPFSPSASSSSAVSVNFSVVNGPAVITNGQCVFTNIGTVVLAANQSGNSNYLAAPQATQSFQVYPGTTPFFTTVGDPRNPCEDGAGFDEENAGIGYVGQPYQISVSEITNLMYARFLNAVAAGDNFYGLYATRMATDPQGGIIRGGSFPKYTYSVKVGFENRPVNFVSLYSAIRYINWLHNGMPATGILDNSTTEDGAYTLLGNNIPTITRNASAKYFLPNQDEWHKAAFFDPEPADPNLPSDYYWPYADQSASGPGGNFTGTLAEVGTGSGISHYGTYDQGGNVTEWTESVVYNPVTGLYDKRITSNGRPYTSTLNVTQIAGLGFRVGKTIPQSAKNPLVIPRMVPVSLPNNLGDQSSRNRGSVAYRFQMGTYEVSNSEYAAFLNAVAKNDSFYQLYSTFMGTDANGGIMRSGSNGSFVYSVKSGFGNKPVNFVRVYSAMRFCNWLHNGAQPNGDTEEGAYRLLGNATANIASVQRNTSARYFLPSVDEWHKAAFYDPSPAALPSASYWIYASKSRVPRSSQINYAGANYGSLTPVGTPGVASYFGTFGQSGNAAEWTEDIYQDPVTSVIFRVVAGGNWASPSNAVSSQGYVNTLPTGTVATGGFRVASITGVPLAPPRAQTITFTQPAAQTFVPNRTFVLSATAPGGAVSFTSRHTNVISIVGATATIRGAGSTVITANQGGNANFEAASAVTRTVTVNKARQTISFPQPAAQTFLLNGTFELTGSAPGGAVSFTTSNRNILSISGTTATMKAKGKVNVTASQSGNTNYNAASNVVRTIVIR
jgi:formylglycine-generating enzyme required for sulfatase activity